MRVKLLVTTEVNRKTYLQGNTVELEDNITKELLARKLAVKLNAMSDIEESDMDLPGNDSDDEEISEAVLPVQPISKQKAKK